MKKTMFFELMIIGSVFVCSILLYSCASTITAYYASLLYKPRPAVAEDPPGLTIDPANCAYLGGPIRAIGDFDFNPEKGAMYSYPGRTVRVPAGEKMVALVHYIFEKGNIAYYGFKRISLPPLENGCSYMLYFTNPDWEAMDLDDSNVKLFKFNPNSKKFEEVGGATLIDKNPWADILRQLRQ